MLGPPRHVEQKPKPSPPPRKPELSTFQHPTKPTRSVTRDYGTRDQNNDNNSEDYHSKFPSPQKFNQVSSSISPPSVNKFRPDNSQVR